MTGGDSREIRSSNFVSDGSDFGMALVCVLNVAEDRGTCLMQIDILNGNGLRWDRMEIG